MGACTARGSHPANGSSPIGINRIVIVGKVHRSSAKMFEARRGFEGNP